MWKTILVALDGSEVAERLTQTLDDLVLLPETRVIFCHVLPQPEAGIELPADRPLGDGSKLGYLQVEKQIQSYQEKLSVRSELELVVGEPATEILRLSYIYQADLIIIGSRGLTGMKRIVQGSVSSQVMEEANCSVMVVKPHQN
jgi:nucleotide-binding universal stress UspA family protein